MRMTDAVGGEGKLLRTIFFQKDFQFPQHTDYPSLFQQVVIHPVLSPISLSLQVSQSLSQILFTYLSACRWLFFFLLPLFRISLNVVIVNVFKLTLHSYTIAWSLRESLASRRHFSKSVNRDVQCVTE